MSNWKTIETLTEIGKPVLLYSPEWEDPDFNPKGIREGFRDGDVDSPIVGAKWSNCQDAWITTIMDEATHWCEQPAKPITRPIPEPDPKSYLVRLTHCQCDSDPYSHKCLYCLAANGSIPVVAELPKSLEGLG